MNRAGLRYRLAAAVGAIVLRIVGRTLRFRTGGTEAIRELRARDQPIVFAFWHAWILPLAFLHRDEGVVVLVSEHGDGEYIARTIRRMGFETARGSSTRGGVRGAKGIVRSLRSGRDVALTPDGPRGPAGVFKPGALVAAQLAGAPVVPVHVASPAAWRLGSWDRFALPRPLSPIEVRYGPPRPIPRDADARTLADVARELETFMNTGEAPT